MQSAGLKHFLHPSLVCLDHADLQVILRFLLKSMGILALLSKGSLVKDHWLSILSEQSLCFVFISHKQSSQPCLGPGLWSEWDGEKWELWFVLVQEEGK